MTTTNNYIKGYEKNTQDIVDTNKRISDIVANNGNGTKDVEIVDARKGKPTLKDRIDDVESQIYKNNDKVTKEIVDARTDFDGDLHQNLNLRLLEDFNNLYKLFYNSTLLEYEGKYITANNSYKGMAEDMQLKGRTLQNLLKLVRTDIIVQYGSVSIWELYKPNTIYTIKVTNKTTETKQFYINENCFTSPTEFTVQPSQTSTIKATTLLSFTGTQSVVEILLKNKITHTQPNNLEIIVLEGDWTNKEIPSHFTGIRSVGESGENLELVSCGKNLFDAWLRGKIDSNTGKITYSDMQTFNIVTKYINVKKLTKYVTSVSDQFYSFVAFYDKDKKYISRTNGNQVSKISFETPSNCNYIVLTQYNNNIDFSEELLNTLTTQIEEGIITTAYEPYKGHRQAITLTEPLRGLTNDICDILRLNTMKMIKNVGKATFNGSEDWQIVLDSTNTKMHIYIVVNNCKPGLGRQLICDKFACSTSSSWILNTVNTSSNSRGQIGFTFANDTYTIETWKTWLKANPVTVYYQLATPLETLIDNLNPPRTYNPTTTLFTQYSLIEPMLRCNIPSNIPAKIQSLQSENTKLRGAIEDNNLTSIENSVNQESKITVMELGVI
jgi:hypothetical protein